jgi:superfamily II DNA/RNA helicase
MSLEKLRVELQEILPEKGIVELNSFQSKVVDGLKAGKNLLLEGHEGAGKTTAITISLVQKITEAGEGSPRAIVVCASDDKAHALHAYLEKICRPLDLTVDLAHDRGNKLQQRNDIFDGTEIIVGTAKRLYELYIQNGFNVSKLRLFILDDALNQFKSGYKTQLTRIAESLPKCQYILASASFSDQRIKEFLDEFVAVYSHIEAE